MTTFFRLFLLVSLPLYILDQATKEWAVRVFAAPTDTHWDSIVVIKGFFELVRVHNTGIAFGFGNGGSHSNLVFGGISLCAIGIIGWLWKSGAFPTRTSRLAVALLIAGILGNVTDRLARGYVVDFLLFDLKFMKWPAFNVADACICVAAGLLFLTAFQKEPEKDAAPSVVPDPPG